jgi:hypothetical protein
METRTRMNPIVTRARAAAMAVVLCASACTTPLGNLTVLSAQPLSAAPRALGPVEAVDCAHFLLFFPVVGRISSSFERAMRKALDQVPEGNALIDVTFYNDVLFGYLYNRTCTRVRGTVAVVK